MGDEYLPDYLPGEVEIARVSLRSVTADMIALRARPEGVGIRYRWVAEQEAKNRDEDDPENAVLD